MNKIMNTVQEKISIIKRRQDIEWAITMLIYLYLFTKICTNLIYGPEFMYDTFRYFYFYRAVSFFLVFIIIERKVAIYKWPYIFVAFVYSIATYRFFVEAQYEIELYNMVLAQRVSWGLFLIVLLDIFLTKKTARINKSNKVFVVVAFLAFGGAIAINFNVSSCLIIPFVALFLTPITKRRWLHIIDCFSIAYYLAFVRIMTKSLIDVPYYGQMVEDGYKYYGLFLNIATGGMFSAGAFICALYWGIRLTGELKNKNIGRVTCVIGVIYPIIAASFFSSRAAETGMIAATLMVFIFIGGQKQGHSVRKRMCTVVGAFFAIVACGVLAIFLIKEMDYSFVDNISSDFVRTKVRYVIGFVSHVFDLHSVYETFPDGTLITALDEASSYRISLAIAGLRKASLWGNRDITLTAGTGFFMYPHNNYVTWLIWYGWIGGLAMIAWFISSIVEATKQVLRQNTLCLFSFLWSAFLLVLMITETVLWIYPAAFIMIMVQYPLLIEQSE